MSCIVGPTRSGFYKSNFLSVSNINIFELPTNIKHLSYTPVSVERYVENWKTDVEIAFNPAPIPANTATTLFWMENLLKSRNNTPRNYPGWYFPSQLTNHDVLVSDLYIFYGGLLC